MYVHFYPRIRGDEEEVSPWVRKKLSREYQHLRDPGREHLSHNNVTRQMLPDLKQHQARLGT